MSNTPDEFADYCLCRQVGKAAAPLFAAGLIADPIAFASQLAKPGTVLSEMGRFGDHLAEMAEQAFADGDFKRWSELTADSFATVI
jgi:hypothetical protein